MTMLDIKPGERYLVVNPAVAAETSGDSGEGLEGASPGASSPPVPRPAAAPQPPASLAVTVVERSKWVLEHWSCLTDDGKKLLVGPDDFLRPLPPR